MSGRNIFQLDLVCDNHLYLSLLATIYLFGVLVGSPVCGYLSDKYVATEKMSTHFFILQYTFTGTIFSRFGRRSAILMGSFGQLFISIATAYAPNYVTFALCRFFLSVFGFVANVAAAVLCW